MGSISTNEFKSGVKIILENDPYSIVENEMVKPGKGQAFNRVRIRNLKTGRVIERTFKSGDTVESADVVETDMQYLYTDGEFWHFMVPDTFEQYTAGKEAVGDTMKWLKDGMECVVMLWNGVPLNVTAPAHVELKIVKSDPGVRGDTATGGGKPAELTGQLGSVESRAGGIAGVAADSATVSSGKQWRLSPAAADARQCVAGSSGGARWLADGPAVRRKQVATRAA